MKQSMKIEVKGQWKTRERCQAGGWYSAFTGNDTFRGMQIAVSVGESAETSAVYVDGFRVAADIHTEVNGAALDSDGYGIDRTHCAKLTVEIADDITVGLIETWKRQEIIKESFRKRLLDLAQELGSYADADDMIGNIRRCASPQYPETRLVRSTPIP